MAGASGILGSPHSRSHGKRREDPCHLLRLGSRGVERLIIFRGQGHAAAKIEVDARQPADEADG